MAKPLLTDALWKRIGPLLPPHKPRRRRFPGRKPIGDRKALTGILFVLKTGINWEDLPQEMGCGCGMTCLRRLRDWNQAGVWQRLHETLLAELHEADRIDWARALIDSSFVRARGRGGRTGPSPVDRRKRGSKHQIITAAGGIPLVADTTAANVPDVNPMIPLVDAIPPVRGKPGRRRRRPARMATEATTRTRIAGSCAARHPSVHRATADAAWERAGNVSLVRGADAVVVAQLREAASSQG